VPRRKQPGGIGMSGNLPVGFEDVRTYNLLEDSHVVGFAASRITLVDRAAARFTLGISY
jgi:hypothetical protein